MGCGCAGAPQLEPGPSSPQPRSSAAPQPGTPVSVLATPLSAKPASPTPHPAPAGLPAPGGDSPGTPAARGAGLTPPRHFRFPSSRDQPKALPSPPTRAPQPRGLRPGPGLPGLTCGWARGAPSAPVRWRSGQQAPARRALSAPEPSAGPRPRRRRAGPRPGGGIQGGAPGSSWRGGCGIQTRGCAGLEGGGQEALSYPGQIELFKNIFF